MQSFLAAVATRRVDAQDASIFARERGVRATGEGWVEARERRLELQRAGASHDELLEGIVSGGIARKEQACAHRCPRCWHDRAQKCICARLGSLATVLNVKLLVLMHHKEYLKSGDDAKLLLAMLPSERAELFVFGRRGDLARLYSELSVDGAHTLILWPGDGAHTVDDFVASAPADSPWRSARSGAPPQRASPLLRVLVLDGVYGHARTMFRHLRRAKVTAPHVALHPATLSVYHRAQKSYGAASAAGIVRDGKDDPAALRISTVEAVALLLQELGEPEATSKAIVAALLANNEALRHEPLAGASGQMRKGGGCHVNETG